MAGAGAVLLSEQQQFVGNCLLIVAAFELREEWMKSLVEPLVIGPLVAESPPRTVSDLPGFPIPHDRDDIGRRQPTVCPATFTDFASPWAAWGGRRLSNH